MLEDAYRVPIDEDADDAVNALLIWKLLEVIRTIEGNRCWQFMAWKWVSLWHKRQIEYGEYRRSRKKERRFRRKNEENRRDYCSSPSQESGTRKRKIGGEKREKERCVSAKRIQRIEKIGNKTSCSEKEEEREIDRNESLLVGTKVILSNRQLYGCELWIREWRGRKRADRNYSREWTLSSRATLFILSGITLCVKLFSGKIDV